MTMESERDWHDLAKSRSSRTIPWRLWREHCFAYTFVLDLRSPMCKRISFCGMKLPSVWCS